MNGRNDVTGVNRGQIMQSLLGHIQDFEPYSKSNEKSLKVFCFVFELKFVSHKMNNFNKYDSVTFSPFTRSCNYHLYLVPKYLIASKGDPMPIQHVFFILPSPQPLATTNLFPVSMDLSILEISYSWNHVICNLLCLAFSPSIIFQGSSML